MHINEPRVRRMPCDTLPDKPATIWVDYFRWPRAARPLAKPTASAPKKTYREALLTNVSAAPAEQDALLHDTYLFV